MVSLDDVKQNTAFAESLNANFVLLSDEGGNTARAYGVQMGTRPFANRWTFYIGKDGAIRHIEKNVEAGRHGEQIARTLGDLDFPKRSKDD